MLVPNLIEISKMEKLKEIRINICHRHQQLYKNKLGTRATSLKRIEYDQGLYKSRSI